MVVLRNTYKTLQLGLAFLRSNESALFHEPLHRYSQFHHGRKQPLRQPSQSKQTLDAHHDGNRARRIAFAHEPWCDESPCHQMPSSQ